MFLSLPHLHACLSPPPVHFPLFPRRLCHLATCCVQSVVAQFLDTVSNTSSLWFFTWRLTRVVLIDCRQLSGNPGAKGSHLSTAALKPLRCCNVLRLMRLWCYHGGYSPCRLPVLSDFPGVLPHWQKPSLQSISANLTSASSSWS